MKQPRRVDLYILDMITSMERILSYMEGRDFNSFQQNFMLLDAVTRNFEILGEAARKIPEHLTEKYPHIPWGKMYQLRNIVSHAYFEVDYETLWGIASKQLPQNLEDIKQLLGKEFPDTLR